MPRVSSAAADHVGDLIRQARHRAGLSTDDLGSTARIDSSNVRSYENGRALPNLYTLVRLATALGVEPAELVDGLTEQHFESPGRR